MFNKERKLLKKLQEIQIQIYDCNSIIKCLEPPTTTYRMARDIVDYVRHIMDGDCDCGYLLHNTEGTFDYMEQIGNYFISVAKYEKDKQTYNEELRELQAEECRIKEKLGIK